MKEFVEKLIEKVQDIMCDDCTSCIHKKPQYGFSL